MTFREYLGPENYDRRYRVKIFAVKGRFFWIEPVQRPTVFSGTGITSDSARTLCEAVSRIAKMIKSTAEYKQFETWTNWRKTQLELRAGGRV